MDDVGRGETELQPGAGRDDQDGDLVRGTDGLDVVVVQVRLVLGEATVDGTARGGLTVVPEGLTLLDLSKMRVFLRKLALNAFSRIDVSH